MKLNIKRLDKDLPLPKYQTKGSVGFDLTAREEVIVKPFEVTLIPLNIIAKVPKGYGFFLFSRSSTPLRKGLIVANSVGVVDSDYNGEEDEIKLSVLNITKKSVVVEKGERICQGIILKVEKPEFIEVNKMSQKSRGGFGSTGHK